LRAILGLKRCTSLLSQRASQPTSEVKSKKGTDKLHSPVCPEKPISNLRPEAREWTPGRKLGSPTISNNSCWSLPNGLGSPIQSLTVTSNGHASPPARLFHFPPGSPTMNGHQFIASLDGRQRPHTIPSHTASAKHPWLPPGFAVQSPQRLLSFHITANLCPQTFPVELLSNLHVRMQNVAKALELVDTNHTSAGDLRGLEVLKTSLDELWGTTARAGWIIDTWRSFHANKVIGGGVYVDPGLGSAAINGVDIGGKMGHMQEPIQRPKEKSSDEIKGSGAMYWKEMRQGTSLETMDKRFRPPPGLPAVPKPENDPSSWRSLSPTGSTPPPTSGSIFGEHSARGSAHKKASDGAAFSPVVFPKSPRNSATHTPNRNVSKENRVSTSTCRDCALDLTSNGLEQASWAISTVHA
jgi:hypothetical protein